MNSRSVIPRILLFGAGAVAAWALIPGRGEASSTIWHSLNATTASFLQQTPGAAWSSATGGSGRNHLPTSVMPNGTPGLRCSVDSTDPGAPPLCSTTTAGQRCSAHCDNAQFCSAFIATAAGGAAACSTLGGVNRQCSVLQPVINPTAQSLCSAFGSVPGSSVQCSIMAQGSGQKCSAQNPARFANNQCSTFGGGGGGVVQCSVLKGGGPSRNYCSVGVGVQPGLVPKQCSTFTAAIQCSILPGNRGICTVFNPAPAGTCSAFVAGSNCSVIGGANGNFCVQ
ncbi:MAG: hypothetical protein EYC70_01990 [Planctomycetota bacterium]|nr:MAG: hypothetical protein EYC70_01990 [Planctomycetota bacterium]